jgi:hypothetical protein
MFNRGLRDEIEQERRGQEQMLRDMRSTAVAEGTLQNGGGSTTNLQINSGKIVGSNSAKHRKT